MRGTRFSMDLDRAPCSGTTTKRGILCVSPYARATIFSGFRSCTLLRSQPQNGTYAQAPMRGPIRAPYARDTFINKNKSWTLLRNHYKKRHPMRGPMRAPCARTRFYLDSDRASCFETSGLYWRCRILPPPSSLPRLPPPSSFYQPNPMLQTMRAVNSMALGFRPLPPPFSLLSLPPPPSLLLLPAKPYARPYARCEFDGSGLCWRSRPFVPPPSVLPPSSCPLPAPLSLFYLKQAPMRSLCRPMRAPYARDTILIEFRSCTLLRNHSCA